MLALKHFRDTAKGVADLLPWAALIDDGIVHGKDGSLLSGWFFRGPDIASMTAEERNHLTARINAALARLGSGFATWTDAVRLPTAGYSAPEDSHFPDAVTRMIDGERRRGFLAEGVHFESEYALLVMWTPPLRRKQKLAELIYDDDGQTDADPASRLLAQFKRSLAGLEDMLGELLKMRRMASITWTDRHGRFHRQDELVNYLHFCLTGLLHGINIPPCPMYLDALIGGQELWPGDTPKIGEKFVACAALEGFPAESMPNHLEVLEHLGLAYRYSTRFIPLDLHEAHGHLYRQRRRWKQKERGFLAQVFRTQGGYVNEDALLMGRETEAAITDANSAQVSFGYYTPVIVLMGEDREALLEGARLITREVSRDGFATRIESVNTLEAWLGTLPGNVHPNVRRPLMHTLAMADMLPVSAKWPGLPRNPSPMFPPQSPPLLHAVTGGATPFRLNLHVSDVGHTLIFGPTGAGKSTLLGLIAAQFRRYKNARITAFDKGRSLYVLTEAAGGLHYDLGSDTGSLGLCPLAFLDADADIAWAAEWLAVLYELQTEQAPAPRQREEIHRALRLMQHDPAGRTLTDFLATVQDQEIRSALGAYTLTGPLGSLLDSRTDALADGSFTVFEMEELMGMGEKSLIPVLLYLFRRFEKSLDGSPALLLLDEAWVMLGHPTFREKIREWLKVLRKANCAVVLATQSLSDATRSGILDVLLESCPTRILLPNEEAGKGGTSTVMGPRDFYTVLGLNPAELDIVATAVKKRHYYYVSSEGRRLFELGLGPVTLSFIGASSKEDIAQVRALKAEHGADWPRLWLESRDVEYAWLESGEGRT
jgi:type IV secretion/conjugal transfer VirB4 family ATPase